MTLKQNSFYQYCPKDNNHLSNINSFISETIFIYKKKEITFPYKNSEAPNVNSGHQSESAIDNTTEIDTDFYALLMAEFPKEYEKQFRSIVRKIQSNQLLGEKGYLEIIVMLNDYPGNALIKYLFLATCYYFLRETIKVRKILRQLKEEYPEYKDNPLIKKFYATIDFNNLTLKRTDYKALYLLSYDKESERNRANKDFQVVNELRTDYNVSFLYQPVNEFGAINDLIYFVKGNKPSHLILAGHGNIEKGFVFVFGEGFDKKEGIGVKQMTQLIANLNDYGEAGIILIGCNPDIYKEIKITRKHKTYLICSDSVNVSSFKMFLYGFYSVFNRNYNFKSAYHAGRLSAAIRGFDKTDYLLYQLNQ